MHIAVNARRLSGQRFGIGRYIEYMVRYWDRLLGSGDTVSVFVRTPFEPSELGLSSRITAHLVSPPLTGLLWENFLLTRSAASADVLFCPSYTAPLWSRLPVVVATHSANEAKAGTQTWWESQTYSRLYRMSARRADRVIVPSEATARTVRAHYGVAPARVEVIPLGVDLDVFRPLDDTSALSAVRRRYFGEDVPYILFVGKMSRRRNIGVLLEAFALLKRRSDVPHRLLLFGRNQDDLPLADLIATLGLSNAVVQDDGQVPSHAALVPIYNAASLFVHPTTYDASSLPVLEAFACGLPVVSGAAGGLEELVEGCGYLIEQPRVEAIASAMAAMLQDQALRDRFRANAFRRVQDRSWEAVARRTLDVVSAVVAERRGRRKVATNLARSA